ncbi:MAG TPA: MFS transporter [Opitutaceae bacterium]|nr:MFS transporter [Opitutaceae bacterium]
MPDASASLRLLFATRIARMLAYGILGVVLVLYLAERGFDEARIGLLLTLTLLGDAALSLALSTRADRWGRRRTLVAGAVLMGLGGTVMALTGDFALLLVAATIGVISPTGGEVGPFLAVEQAGVAQVVPDRDRTRIFAWYNVAGYAATAVGALISGGLAEVLQGAGWTRLASYQAMFGLYAALAVAVGVLSACAGRGVEAPAAAGRKSTGPVAALTGLHDSRGLVLRLAGLFSLDAFAGGFIVQSFLVYWFHLRFGAGEAALGGVFFGANLLSGLSALAAVPLARRIGLVNTMVWTHLPSNVLLMLVPLMPSFATAVAMLLLRHAISQMDVPTRQSYVNAVVAPGERAAANGVTGTARQLGAALAPVVAGPLVGSAAFAAAPFFISGGLKIAYDLLLWRSFRAVRPPEERPAPPADQRR